MKNQIILKARYGLKHKLEKLEENKFRTTELSRFSFEGKDDEGKFYGVSYIDFDGGPFMHVDCLAPWDESKIITEFVLGQEDERILWVDIITKDASEKNENS